MYSWRNYCAVVGGVIVQLAPKEVVGEAGGANKKCLAPKGVVGEVGGVNKKCFGAKRSSWRSRRS